MFRRRLVPLKEECNELETRFWDVIWFFLAIFLWVAFFMVLFMVIGDLFRDRTTSGCRQGDVGDRPDLPAVPRHLHLPDRPRQRYERAGLASARRRPGARPGVRADRRGLVGGGAGAAEQIEKAKSLLDSGAITLDEFNALKAKALG